MDYKLYFALLKGIATYCPGIRRLSFMGTGGTNSARYCYSVWLRHLVMAYKNGLNVEPQIIAELGPGDSLGIGLAALLSGVEKYYALDIVPFANNKRNARIFTELVNLFKRRAPIPDDKEFPRVKPCLDSYAFPDYILSENCLEGSLALSRIEAIRKELRNLGVRDNSAARIKYFVPWNIPARVEEEAVDMIFSQAVLEHIDDLEDIYKRLFCYLKPKGLMSHQVDYSSHNLSEKWNGHWAYSDFLWKIIKGARRYLLNRQPHSTHINLMREAGFNIIFEKKYRDSSGIKKSYGLSDDDLTIRSAFIQAVKNEY